MRFSILISIIFAGSISNADVYDYIVDLDGEGISQCRKSDSKSIDDWAKKSMAEAKKDGANCARANQQEILECDYKNRVMKVIAFKTKRECDEMRGLLFAKLHLDKEKDSKKKHAKEELSYIWKKSSFRGGCADISPVDSQMFQSLCSIKSKSDKLISLDCSKSKEMSMDGIVLYSTEKHCLDDNK